MGDDDAAAVVVAGHDTEDAPVDFPSVHRVAGRDNDDDDDYDDDDDDDDDDNDDDTFQGTF